MTVKILASESPALTGMNPEKMASSWGTQGLSKVEDTTEWFLGKKWNSRVSPLEAPVMLSGVNLRPSEPTLTTVFLAVTRVRRAVRGRRVLVVGSILVDVAWLGRRCWLW